MKDKLWEKLGMILISLWFVLLIGGMIWIVVRGYIFNVSDAF